MASQTAAIESLNAGVVFVLLELPLPRRCVRSLEETIRPLTASRCGLGWLPGPPPLGRDAAGVPRMRVTSWKRAAAAGRATAPWPGGRQWRT